MKLMIVDDSSEMRKLIRSVVAQPADSVTECADGSEVLSTFQREQPDVVLMDLQMPNVSGIAATRTLKKEFPDARVIIVSNFNEQEYRDEARDAGAASYFTKDNLIQLKEFVRQS
ncbi:MAG: response regulator transcription factor [Bacteroidota bacterium]